jgi:antitoxin component YwqK of YwqJK toxin-antitoxin module
MQISDLKIDLKLFRQPILAEMDEHLNYDDGINVNYNNIPLFYDRERFTGTVFESEVDYARLIEYENGLMNGKWFYFYENGQIGGEAIYEDSEEIAGKYWYKSGKLESLWNRNEATSWYENGVLMYEKKLNSDQPIAEEIHYFQNEQVKSRKVYQVLEQTSNTVYFFKDGTEAYRMSGGGENFTFNHEIFLEKYKGLINNPIAPDDHYQTEAEKLDFVWRWLIRLPDKAKFRELVHFLLVHPNKTIFKEFAHKIEQWYALKTGISFTRGGGMAFFLDTYFAEDQDLKDLILRQT